jgi:hypothetical protein
MGLPAANAGAPGWQRNLLFNRRRHGATLAALKQGPGVAGSLLQQLDDQHVTDPRHDLLKEPGS